MKVTVKGLGDVGMITDVDAPELPVNGWTNLLNMRCVHGRIEPMDGYADVTSWLNVGTKDVYAHALGKLETTTSFYWVYPYDDDGDGQCEAIYAMNASGTVTDITRSAGASPYTGTSTDLWQTAFYNGLLILNNGSDCPQYWDGDTSNDCVNLPWDATHDWDDIDGAATEYHAKVIRSFKNFLFALDITEGTTNYHQMVHWSSVADPGARPSWDYSLATEESGRVNLTETSGHVLDCIPYKENLIVFKEDAIHTANYVGGQFVFQFRVASTSHGLWAPNCCVEANGLLYCLGDGVVYTFDGVTPRNILEGKLADELFEQIDVAEYKKCFLTHHKEENEVWICFPQSGDTWATKCLIHNFGNGTWYYRTIPASSTIKTGIIEEASDDDAWDYESSLAWNAETVEAWDERAYSPIGDTLVAASGQLIQFGQGVTSDTIEAVRTDIVVEDPTSWYMTRTMYPVGTGSAFNIAIGGQKFVDGPVFWETEQSFTPGETRKLDWRTTYPVKAIQVTYSGSGTFTFDSYVIDHVKTGER